MPKLLGLKGFTLIEILLVVFLLSIVAVLTLPLFSKSLESMQLKKSAEDLAYLMKYAQSRALLKAVTLRLEIDLTHQSYILKQHVVDENAEEGDDFESISNAIGRNNELPESVIFDKVKPSIDFYKDGKVEPVLISVCLKNKSHVVNKICYSITTKLKRGSVDLIEGNIDDAQ